MIQLRLEFMDPWDCHRMDYNSGSGQHSHRHHNNHRRSRNQSFSSSLFAAICKSTEVEAGMMVCKKSSSGVETRNFKAEYRIMRNSRIERQWEDDPWLNDVKSIRGRSAKTGLFNAEKCEAEAAFNKHREFHQAFQSNKPSAAFRRSDSARNTSSFSCLYLSSDVESLHTHSSSIRTAKTERNSHQVGREDRACKWDIGGECPRDFYGKSLIRERDFRSTKKPFIPADHQAKTMSKSETRKDSKKLRQPNSPGRKLTNFLNALFMAGGTKKPKPSSSSSVSDSNSYDSSEMKSASVYSFSSSVQSKPCLSKTSGRSKNNSGMSQKSVTFYPTSAVVDEDSRPCGQKYPQIKEKIRAPISNPSNYPQMRHTSTHAYKLPQISKELKLHIFGEDSHATAAATAAKDITGKYEKENSIMEAVVIRDLDIEEEQEEEDGTDDSSCSSADLFELENWAAIDISNVYQQNLPGYGNTHLDTNKTIAKEVNRVIINTM